MRAPEFLIGHVIFKLGYNQIYQLKTTISFKSSLPSNHVSNLSWFMECTEHYHWKKDHFFPQRLQHNGGGIIFGGVSTFFGAF